MVEAALDPLRALVLVASQPGTASAAISAAASASASASASSASASHITAVAEAMARVGNVSGDALRELYDMRLSEMFVRFVE